MMQTKNIIGIFLIVAIAISVGILLWRNNLIKNAKEAIEKIKNIDKLNIEKKLNDTKFKKLTGKTLEQFKIIKEMFNEIKINNLNEIVIIGKDIIDEASKIYESLSMESNQLEDKINTVPILYKKINNHIPAQLEEISNNYHEMLNIGLAFTSSIDEQIKLIEKELIESIDLLNKLNTKKVINIYNKMEIEIETLYSILETEIKSKSIVENKQIELRKYLDHTKRQNHNLYIELDRLNQDFIFIKNEASLVRSWDMQLNNIEKRLANIDKNIQNNEAIYSKIGRLHNEINEDLKRVEEEQLKFWDELQDIPKRLKRIKYTTKIYTNKLNKIKRNMERQNLPGVPDSYLTIFYAASEEVIDLEEQLKLVRINIDDVQKQLSIVIADIDILQEKTKQLIQDAVVTERLIRKAIQYKNNNNIKMALDQAKYLYEMQYEYNKSMIMIGKELNKIDYNIMEITIDKYKEEIKKLEEIKEINN